MDAEELSIYEFCGKEKEFTAGTSFFCNYCDDCLKLVLHETKEARKQIRDERKAARSQKAR